jgi:hypothetical protein
MNTASNNKSQQKPPTYMVFKSFVPLEEQIQVCREVLECHERNNIDGESKITSTPISQNSIKLALGIGCGGNLSPQLPLAARILQQGFAKARDDCATAQYNNNNQNSLSALDTLQNPSTPLTGLALLYGPNAFMKAHYDSPTQPGQGHEWLACLSLGATVMFRCNNQILPLHSGDILVLDSMATLHGVEEILASDNEDTTVNGLLPLNCRLGILMWQGKFQNQLEDTNSSDDAMIEGMGALFGDSDDESE